MVWLTPFLSLSVAHAPFLHSVDPNDLPVGIIGEPDTRVTVTMNSPISLHCYAMGWPRPQITWWHGDRLLPLVSDDYEQDTDYTLLIRSVTLSNLGVYTCQAFNGIGTPASWSLTLQAIGPVYNVKPEQQEYTKYLVQPPKRPTTEKPQYPYRPTRTQTPETQTYAPVYPIRPSRIPQVIPLETTTSRPDTAKFKGERLTVCVCVFPGLRRSIVFKQLQGCFEFETLHHVFKQTIMHILNFHVLCCIDYNSGATPKSSSCMRI